MSDPGRPLNRPKAPAGKPAAAKGAARPFARGPLKPPVKPPAGAPPLAGDEAPAPNSKRLLIAAGAGVAALLLIVALVVAMSGGRKPTVKADTAGEQAAPAKEAPRNPAAVVVQPSAEDAAVEKAILDLIEWGDFKGAGAAIKALPEAARGRITPKFASAAEAKYETMLRDAKLLVKRGNVADAKAHLLKSADWGLPALAERAQKDADLLSVAAVARAEQKPDAPEPVPALKPDPAPAPEPEKKGPPPAPAAERKAPEPAAAPKSETKT